MSLLSFPDISDNSCSVTRGNNYNLLNRSFITTYGIYTENTPRLTCGTPLVTGARLRYKWIRPPASMRGPASTWGPASNRSFTVYNSNIIGRLIPPPLPFLILIGPQRITRGATQYEGGGSCGPPVCMLKRPWLNQHLKLLSFPSKRHSHSWYTSTRTCLLMIFNIPTVYKMSSCSRW